MAAKVLDSHALLAFFQGEQAALYKASGKLAYADAFAAALAKLRNAELITGDRDFKAVEGEIKIGWLK